MELILARQAGTQILVTCDERSSHTFDLLTLMPGNNGLSDPLDDPVAYGKAIYQALFPQETAAWSTLHAKPERILFVSTDDTIDAIPWEYAHGPDDFVVLEYRFVRGLPANHRIASLTLDKGLHIVAIPSNPLSHDLEPLNIDGEWIRLKEIIQELKEFAITLERTRPSTLERVGLLVANQQQRIVHFMGHGGQDEKAGALLCFEKDNGDLDAVTARDFLRQLRGNVFLVTLNACVSASSGETLLSNLAASLVQQKIPYSLGMRFSIPDEDALTFSRTFYGYLARGSSVEEATYRVRLALSRNQQRQWMIGVPVLYTSLSAPAIGFASVAGTPEINEYQPKIEVSALPRAEGAFQGRIDELKQLGDLLTGDHRPRLVTIHGSGGQGKTALAREAVERFAFAWPGGVWATTLENLPSREVFVSDLARFLGINTQTVANSEEVERLVIARLALKRTLIVLDNVETLVEAVETNNEEAIRLAQFLREQLPRPPVSLVATSRSFLGWTGEIGCELTGLTPIEGIRLFKQHAPQREKEIDHVIAWELSEQVEGHPLSLRLLGSAFNVSSISFSAFVKEYEAQLLSTENKYVRVDHRHRTLYASIETSVRYLDTELADLFSKLWLFHAPFMPETAVEIFDPAHDDAKDEDSPVNDRLYALWKRGLLTREEGTVREGTIQFYHVLPTIRPYIEKYLAGAEEREELLVRFGEVFARGVRNLYKELDRGGAAAFIALQAREDLDRGASCVMGVARGYYLLYWGWILQRLFDTRRGLKLIEQALEIGQDQDQQLKLRALNNIALVYQATGRLKQALELYEQALPLEREVGDRAGEGTLLSNIAGVYQVTGQQKQALEVYEQALSLKREVGDPAGEAITLNNMGEMYRTTGRLKQALELYEQALPLEREVGDRAGEANTLNNIALVYQATGQPKRALEVYEQALPLKREVGDRAGEANTLSNIAGVYQATGQPKRALEVYEQALPLRREVGDHAGEAVTLNNMAVLYQATGQPKRALEVYEQALPLRREVGDRAGEATTLVNIADVLYKDLKRSQEAITNMEQAITVLVETGLPQDAAGQTRDQLQRYLDAMRQGLSPEPIDIGPATMPSDQLQAFVYNTIAVMTTMPERGAEWREDIVNGLQDAQERRWGGQTEVEFFTAVLAILDRKAALLPDDHPYAPAVAEIQEGIAAGGLEDDETPQDDNTPFDPELIPLSIAALLGGPQEKMAHVQYLTAIGTQTTDEGLKALLQVIQLALFGSDLSQLGQNLGGLYRQAWEAIVVGVETGGVDPRLFEMIVQNTLAVLGPVAEKRGEWRDNLLKIKSQAVEGDAKELVALVDAVVGLLDAGGNPAGLGMDLRGVYARMWQVIVEPLGK